MVSPAAVFLCVYHVALAVLGSVFFENFLFKDFDNSFSIVKIIFCCSFVLCLSLLSMLLFEILGFLTTTLKLFIWYIDITSLVLFIYLIIPISLIYTYVTYEDEEAANGLFKFNYFYNALRKMKNKKNILPEHVKANFMRRLLYVSEDLMKQMENYNRKIRNKNKQKICQFIIGCLIILPLIWFTFYKISMITLKNNNDIYDQSSDLYNIGNVLQEKLNDVNREFSQDYDTNSEKNKNSFFFKVMKNLLIYMSVTGMTLVSALSAFTSLYSPYTNISLFFFFVTVKKVKIIENKIKFVTNELSLKKKLLVLYDHPQLMQTFHCRNAGDSSTLHGSLTNGGSLIEDRIGSAAFGVDIPVEHTTTSSLHSSEGPYHHIATMQRYSNMGMGENIDGGLSDQLATIMCDHFVGTSTGEKHSQTRMGTGQDEVEYIGCKPFKKCNLYLGSHKSIYKDIYETFMKKENDFDLGEMLPGGEDDEETCMGEDIRKDLPTFEGEDNLSNLSNLEKRCSIREMETPHRGHANPLVPSRGEETAARSHTDEENGECWDCNNPRGQQPNSIFSTAQMNKMGSGSSLYKRSIKSGSSVGERKHVYYTGRFLFFKTTDGEEKHLQSRQHEGDTEMVDFQMGGELCPEATAAPGEEKERKKQKRQKKGTAFLSRLRGICSVRRFFQHSEMLPQGGTKQDIANVEKGANADGATPKQRRHISEFLSASIERSYRTLKSVKDFFKRNKANAKKKKKKEILMQDIKSLEYMAKNLYFLLDDVIKEQIRINQSSSFTGMLLYLLGILMSILCVYKITRTCYIIYMVEIYYRFICTYSSGHVLMLFYAKNINIDFINDLKKVLHIVHININLENYVVSITSVLLLCFIFANLKSFMERIIKLRYSAKSSLYSNLAILLMCEIMDLYFSAYCIQLFDYLPAMEKMKILYIFFNNNLLDLLKLKYHFDFVYVISLFISLFLIRLHHQHRSSQFREI
ncbi:Uncharacterized protein PCOAH_00049300 [Plasmodium coatneyi]|uniref:Abscisic acid G-protein coupled receptor-like domain-containing protein n=1 Tax=Plasmodium coatneyi TaxID=208452 RepID=A0A1B1E6J6_9APIC|nr:Uncharacterized protein PCOAH_00049300 [Plasmodium coatneyi]ANQ10631.1 Uncharacterized protein PCOAH_00049300 [Plasmodium coatneyi]